MRLSEYSAEELVCLGCASVVTTGPSIDTPTICGVVGTRRVTPTLSPPTGGSVGSLVGVVSSDRRRTDQ